MNKKQNPKLTANAQALRNNMTKEERKLWYDCLKKLSVTVNRQKVFGKYILDFYCASAKVAIELDGSQHYEQPGIENDRIRDEYFRSLDLGIRRYSNAEINQHFTGVCEDILNCLRVSE